MTEKTAADSDRPGQDKTTTEEGFGIDKESRIPLWNKYTLSIEEAAEYFRIGENKLRKLVSENKSADYLLWNGARVQIKRKKFEEYIDRLNVI